VNDVQYRTATAVEVRHAQRIIELIAVPYNESTRVLRRDRWVTESVDPQAFHGLRGERLTVNRAHDPENPLGFVSKFHPNDTRGLVAELKISNTSAGTDVLELAADGLLSSSIGFQPLAEDWSADRSTVKITKAKLVHIALTGDPAYKGAKVLSVRTDAGPQVRVPTPVLDRIRLMVLADRAGIDLQSPQ
jgi:HK97 family phage prohead protease